MSTTPLSLYPDQLTDLSVRQLAELPAPQLVEADQNLDALIRWARDMRTKLDAALDQRFGETARAALRESGRDFGTTHIAEGGLAVKFELPKKVSWDQKKLKAIAERIVASGEAVEGYMDVSFSVSESRYTNWPPTLQEQFAEARTVKAGKPTFELTLDSEQ